MLDELGTLATHMSLHTADPGTTGTSEASGGSYARIASSWNAAGPSAMSHGQLDFNAPAGTFTHVGFWSALSGGTFYGSAQLAVAKVLGTAGTCTVEQVTVSLADGQVIALTGASDELRLLLHNASPKVLQAPTRIDPDALFVSDMSGYDAEQRCYPNLVPVAQRRALALVRGATDEAGPVFDSDTGEVWLDQTSSAGLIECVTPALTSSSVFTIEWAGTCPRDGVARRLWHSVTGSAVLTTRTGGGLEYYDGTSVVSGSTINALLPSLAAWGEWEARTIINGTSVDVDVRIPGGSWVSAISGGTGSGATLTSDDLYVGSSDTTQPFRGKCSSLRLRDGDETSTPVALFTPNLFLAGNRANGDTADDEYNVTWTLTRPAASGADLPARLAAGARRFVLPGTVGAYISTNVENDVSGDLEIEWRALNGWSPSLQYAVISNHHTGDLAARIDINTSGNITYFWTEDGTTTQIDSFALGGAEHEYMKLTHDVDNGASGNVVTIYGSDDGQTWTQLGTTTNSGTASLWTGGTATWATSAEEGTSVLAQNELVYCVVRDGIGGTPVMRIDAADANVDLSTWTDPVTGQTNTINRVTTTRQRHIELVEASQEALQFDGGTDDATIVGDDSIGDFDASEGLSVVVDMRLHQASSGGWQTIISNGDSGNEPFLMVTNGANAETYFNMDDGSTIGGGGNASLPFGERRLISTSSGASDHENYSNGVSAGSGTQAVGDRVADHPMRLGTRGDRGGTRGAYTLFGVAVIKRRVSDTDAGVIAEERL